MIEEDIIRKHDSGRNPFRTPEGYFENFTDRLMQRIAEEEKAHVKVVPMKPRKRLMRWAVAAAIVGIFVVAGTYIYKHQSPLAPQTDFAEFAYNEDNLEDILDYEMLDNNQIAYYLTEAY